MSNYFTSQSKSPSAAITRRKYCAQNLERPGGSCETELTFYQVGLRVREK